MKCHSHVGTFARKIYVAIFLLAHLKQIGSFPDCPYTGYYVLAGPLLLGHCIFIRGKDSVKAATRMKIMHNKVLKAIEGDGTSTRLIHFSIM